MSPRNIRWCVEPGEIPGRSRWSRLARRARRAQAWIQRLALLGVGACGGVIVAKLFLR